MHNIFYNNCTIGSCFNKPIESKISILSRSKVFTWFFVENVWQITLIRPKESYTRLCEHRVALKGETFRILPKVFDYYLYPFYTYAQLKSTNAIYRLSYKNQLLSKQLFINKNSAKTAVFAIKADPNLNSNLKSHWPTINLFISYYYICLVCYCN